MFKTKQSPNGIMREYLENNAFVYGTIFQFYFRLVKYYLYVHMKLTLSVV